MRGHIDAAFDGMRADHLRTWQSGTVIGIAQWVCRLLAQEIDTQFNCQ